MGLWEDIIRNKNMRDGKKSTAKSTKKDAKAVESSFLADAYNSITDGNGALGLIPGYNQQKQYQENIAPGIQQGIDDYIKSGTRTNADAIAAGQPHLAPKPYVDPLFSNAPEVNPQAAAAAYGNRVAPAPQYESAVLPEVQAPQYTPPAARQAAPVQAAPAVQSDIPLQRRGYIPNRQVKADATNLMDLYGQGDGFGIEW